ncbi:hypothetical protein V6N13_110788 [Hibiscus sabdariffa]
MANFIRNQRVDLALLQEIKKEEFSEAEVGNVECKEIVKEFFSDHEIQMGGIGCKLKAASASKMAFKGRLAGYSLVKAVWHPSRARPVVGVDLEFARLVAVNLGLNLFREANWVGNVDFIVK